MDRAHGLFESLKGSISFRGPRKNLVLEELCERLSQYSIILHKLFVITSQPKEPYHFSQTSWSMPVYHSSSFAGIYCHTIAGNNVAQVLNLGLRKCTLFELEKRLVLLQDLKHLSKMIHMLLKCPAIYEYAIHEHQHKPSHKLSKYRVHQALKCSRGID
jgi:hypothetical protein